jgi:hypothetical protein
VSSLEESLQAMTALKEGTRARLDAAESALAAAHEAARAQVST